MLSPISKTETLCVNKDVEEAKLFQNFKTIFSCSICLSYIMKPRMTPFGHMFCSDCLHKWIQSIYPLTHCSCCRESFKLDDFDQFHMKNRSLMNYKNNVSYDEIMKIIDEIETRERLSGNFSNSSYFYNGRLIKTASLQTPPDVSIGDSRKSKIKFLIILAI